MDSDDQPVFGGGLRRTQDAAIEESGLIGTRRRWTNINRFEIIFLTIAVLATIISDGLTIYRVSTVPSIQDPDFVYGIVLIVNSIFLLIFLMTGIFQQRITDIVAFFISAVMLTIYVIVHFILRKEEKDDKPIDAQLRLARLIFTIFFNILFLPLSIMVIRDYERDEFAKRLFGVFPEARWPLKIYNIFDCVARVNTMLSISVCFLNLYNFNQYELYDKILLGIGIVVALLWLGFGVGMIHLESRALVITFYLISLLQPGYLVYCLYSAISNPSEITTTVITSTFTTTLTSSTAQMFASSEMTNLISTTIPGLIDMVLKSARELPITVVLYVCVGFNIFTHLLSMVLAFFCIRNFGKGLKERVFNSRFDKLFQNCCSKR